MEKIVDFLKLFAEKHLIPALVSVSVAIIGVVAFPDVLGIKSKTGSVIFGIFLFCICFLLIQFCVWLFNVVKKAKQKNESRLQEEQDREERLRDNLEDLWDYVDCLSSQDKKCLFTFLKTDNKPIEVVSSIYFNGLFSDRYKVVSTVKTNESSDSYTQLSDVDSIPGFHPVIPTRLYRLRDDFFKMLKYSYDNYHRISHFDMEDDDNG